MQKNYLIVKFKMKGLQINGNKAKTQPLTSTQMIPYFKYYTD